MVQGHSDARVGRALQCIRKRRAIAAYGFAGTVRRLCGLATRVARRRSPGAPTRVLARAVGRDNSVGVALPESAAGGAEFSWSDVAVHAAHAIGRTVEEVEQAGRRYLVYGATCRIQGAALSLHGANGCGSGYAHRESREIGNRAVDRLLHQHARTANADRSEEHFSRAIEHGA